MFTQCPSCSMHFRVNAQQLRTAAGQVRCGRCQQVFNSLLALTDELPANATLTAPDQPQHPTTDLPPEHTVATDAAILPEGTPATIEPASPEGIGEFAAQKRPRSRGLGTGFWLISNLALATLLMAQGAYTFKDALAQSLALRPTMERFCDAAKCELAAWRDTSQLQQLDSDIRAIDQPNDTLRVNLTLLNSAALAQPYPALQLSLASNDGSVIGLRTFQPGEYLGLPNSDDLRLLSNQAVQVAFDLVDPGEDAASFQFKLL